MEAVPFHWSDYLSAEGLSDIAPTGSSSHGGGQSGRDGREILNSIGRNRSCCAQKSPSVALKDDMIASQDQNHHLGTTSKFETSEAGIDQAPPQQAPSQVIYPTKTGPDVSTQGFNDLRALVPDQVCTCAACLDGYDCPSHLYRHEYPDCCSSTLGCRIAGCEWTTTPLKSRDHGYFNNLRELFYHERTPHYGKHGDYRCRETNCKFTTKRWGDLMRHSSSKHCINPKSFECPVLDCKYHQRGFIRKDKLNDHVRKVHGGHSQPSKPNQAIKPKVGDRA